LPNQVSVIKPDQVSRSFRAVQDRTGVTWRRVPPVRRPCSRDTGAGQAVEPGFSPEAGAATSHLWRDRPRHQQLRLLIARPNEGGFTVIDAFSRIVPLGRGPRPQRRALREAMDRASARWRLCAEKLAAAQRLAVTVGGDRSLPPREERAEFAERVRRRRESRSTSSSQPKRLGWRCSAATSCSSPATDRR
jgi:hypothetical protein